MVEDPASPAAGMPDVATGLRLFDELFTRLELKAA